MQQNIIRKNEKLAFIDLHIDKSQDTNVGGHFAQKISKRVSKIFCF